MLKICWGENSYFKLLEGFHMRGGHIERDRRLDKFNEGLKDLLIIKNKFPIKIVKA